MDTKLTNGDFQRDAGGIPLLLGQEEEIIQQAMISLTARRGAFSLDPGLGSRLYQLPRCQDDLLEQLALSYIQEALMDLPAFRVQQVQCRYDPQADQLILTLYALVSENPYQVTMTL